MMTLLLCAVVGAVCFVGGWKYREYTARVLLKAVLQEMKNDIASNVVEVTIEKHNDTFYVYNKETGEFLAQGATGTEVNDLLSKAYPTKSFTTDRKKAVELGYVNESV